MNLEFCLVKVDLSATDNSNENLAIIGFFLYECVEFPSTIFKMTQ